MKTLTGILLLWLILTLLNYYFSYGFYASFLWIAMNGFLLAMTVLQIIKLVKGQNGTPQLLVVKIVVLVVLLVLTLQETWVSRGIEKADWALLKSKRTDIITQAKLGNLKSANQEDARIYRLAFKFPIVSVGGNNVWISHDYDTNDVTVRFSIRRNMYGNPLTTFVYTEDEKSIDKFEKRIQENPTENWKLERGWYRIQEENF